MKLPWRPTGSISDASSAPSMIDCRATDSSLPARLVNLRWPPRHRRMKFIRSVGPYFPAFTGRGFCSSPREDRADTSSPCLMRTCRRRRPRGWPRASPKPPNTRACSPNRACASSFPRSSTAPTTGRDTRASATPISRIASSSTAWRSRWDGTSSATKSRRCCRRSTPSRPSPPARRWALPDTVRAACSPFIAPPSTPASTRASSAATSARARGSGANPSTAMSGGCWNGMAMRRSRVSSRRAAC